MQEFLRTFSAAFNQSLRTALIRAYIEGYNECRDSNRMIWTVDDLRHRQALAEQFADNYIAEVNE
jgi:hypothetical protein